MTRVRGSTPTEWNDQERTALEQALDRLWSVPTVGLPEQHGSPAFNPSFWRRLIDETPTPLDGDPVEAWNEARRWLRTGDLDRLLDDDAPVVLGQGDPNADNFLLESSPATCRLVWSTSRTQAAAAEPSSWRT